MSTTSAALCAASVTSLVVFPLLRKTFAAADRKKHCKTTTVIQTAPATFTRIWLLLPIGVVPGTVPVIERTPKTIVATYVMKKHPNRRVESVRAAS